jgi:hypothetical protein
MPRYWIGVVSRQHVMRGVEGSFAQVCHGKCAPLQRLKTGDWLIYYSPRTEYPDGASYQAFTAIGRMRNDTVYQVEMSADFHPFRRDVDFVPSIDAPIRPLLGGLSFIQNTSNWGMIFRRGLFEITEADFRLIADAMGASTE